MAVALDSLIERLREDRRLGSQVIETLYLPQETASYGELDPPLSAPLAGALAATGVERLWSHQVDGLEALGRGEDVLITTPTASGKSLVFHLPVLEEVARGGDGKALFLFPLKALGQDQKGKLDQLARAADLQGDDCRIAIYDGDTPRSERQAILAAPPRVVISNPDMLHFGLLPNWQKWTPFLENLRWVVLDELHTYRGIFGSHFHHVLRRLDRVCRAVGATPQIIASSATAENASSFGEQLTGRDFHWISQPGSPREGRHFLLCQPATSAYTTTLQLLVFLLENNLKTIVFTKARRITELLYKWLKQQAPQLAPRVANYRSGFLAEERREIEQALFDGRLDGVISTSALEMGIDVGGLDACILVGYPGSVMATWQRSGRVGRAGKESITALVALPDALDQYFLARPQELVGRPLEHLIVDPENEPVASGHLVCAAAERPLRRGEDAEYLDRHAAVIGELLRASELVEAADGSEIYCPSKRPHRDINLRGGGDGFTILDADRDRVIGTVEGIRVLRECHLGAIYLHAGRQYLVRELDFDGKKVHVESARVEYFTTPLTEKKTEILEILDQLEVGPLKAWLGRLRVTERVVGFERKRIQGQDVLDRHSLDLPPVSYETVGLWWAAPPAIEETIRQRGEHFMGALHAAEHAAISLLPLVALCDRGDVGGISIPLHSQVRTGAVFIYDGHPGGVGIAARGFERLEDLLERVVGLLEQCECEGGCPSCVVSPKCGNGNRPLDKAGAARFLRLLLGRETAIDSETDAPRPEWSEPGWEPPPPPTREMAGRRLVWQATGEPQAELRTGDLPTGTRDRGRSPAWLESGDAAPVAVPVSRARPPSPSARTGDDRGPVLRGPRRPRRSTETMLFDLETRRSAKEVGGWANIHRMLLATGVVLHLEQGRFETFFEDRVLDLIERLERADLVVGFNIRRFDYPLLSAYTGIDYNRTLPTLDLLEEVHRQIGRRISLNDLARETLGEEKSADGLQSLEWVKQGRLDLVEEYCRHDVEILRDLYLFGRREGFVLYRDKRKRVLKLPVDW